MAYKCIKKLVVVMDPLLTLILLKVQANDLTHFFFPPSSLFIELPSFSKLDKVQTNELALPNMYHHSYELDEVQESNWLPCFKDKIKDYQKTWPTNTKEFRVCVIKGHGTMPVSHFPKNDGGNIRMLILLPTLSS
jgi:hypothetical protein